MGSGEIIWSRVFEVVWKESGNPTVSGEGLEESGDLGKYNELWGSQGSGRQRSR